jgi:hypothetical protein
MEKWEKCKNDTRLCNGFTLAVSAQTRGTLIALKQSELIKTTQNVHHCIRLTADWPISHVYQTVWDEDASQFEDMAWN